MNVSLQFDCVSQPAQAASTLSRSGSSSFAHTLSVVAGEKSALRAVTAEHSIKKEIADKKADRAKAADASVTPAMASNVRDTDKRLPVTLHTNGTKQQSAADRTTEQPLSFRAGTEQVATVQANDAKVAARTGAVQASGVQAGAGQAASGTQPVFTDEQANAGTTREDQVQGAGKQDAKAPEDKNADGPAPMQSNDVSGVETSADGAPVVNERGMSEASGGNAGTEALPQTGFPLSFPGTVSDVGQGAPDADTMSALAPATGLVSASGVQSSKQSASGKEVAGAEGKHKAAAAEFMSTAPATPTVGAPVTATNTSSGQHGSSQPGENGQALQQTLQLAPAAGGTNFHAAGSGGTAASANSNALPVATHVEPADVSPAKTVINTSQLIQSMHQAEMRVGMNSAEFGQISISTSISHQVLSASISLGHAELGRALALHMPAMEEKLSNTYGVQTRLEMREVSAGSREGGSQQANERQQQGRAGKTSTGSDSGTVAAGMTVLPTLTTTPAGSGMRLDVLY